MPKSPFFMLIRKSEGCLGLGRREERASKASEGVRNKNRTASRRGGGIRSRRSHTCGHSPLNQGNRAPSITLIMAQILSKDKPAPHGSQASQQSP